MKSTRAEGPHSSLRDPKSVTAGKKRPPLNQQPIGTELDSADKFNSEGTQSTIVVESSIVRRQGDENSEARPRDTPAASLRPADFAPAFTTIPRTSDRKPRRNKVAESQRFKEVVAETKKSPHYSDLFVRDVDAKTSSASWFFYHLENAIAAGRRIYIYRRLALIVLNIRGQPFLTSRKSIKPSCFSLTLSHF